MSFKKQSSTLPQLSTDPEQNRFLTQFLTQNMLENASIKTTQTKEDQDGKKVKPYTLYLINVSTSDLEYTVAKRYSQFSDLFESISKLVGFKDEPFPKKTIFSSGVDPTVVNHRVEYFNRFLVKLQSIGTKNPPASVEFYRFLRIMQKYRQERIVLPSQMHKQKSEDTLIELLIKLATEDDIDVLPILVEIEKQILEFKIKVSSEAIRQLFFGLGKRRGLIQLALTTILEPICEKTLQLINRLFSFEHNRDAEQYIKIFTCCSIQTIQIHNMNMLLPNSTRLHFFNLVELYMKKNCGYQEEALLFKIFHDQSLMKEYILWTSSREKSSIKAELYQQIPTPKTNKSNTTETFNLVMAVVEFDYIEWKLLRELKLDDKEISMFVCKDNFLKIVMVTVAKPNQLEEVFQDPFKWNTNIVNSTFDPYTKIAEYQLRLNNLTKVFTFNFELTTEFNYVLAVKKPLSHKQKKKPDYDSYYQVIKLENQEVGQGEDSIISTITIWNYFETESSVNFFSSEISGSTHHLFDSVQRIQQIAAE